LFFTTKMVVGIQRVGGGGGGGEDTGTYGRILLPPAKVIWQI